MLPLTPPRYEVLGDIIAAGGAAPFVEICNRLPSISASSLSVYGARLEADGYIKRKRSFVNNRSKTVLEVTDLGRKQYTKQRAALEILAA
jgi:DNA-binding MarR family transcriptional regulator